MEHKLGGRKPGAKNKIPKSVKENVLAVFVRLGGTAGMARWAKENESEFYKIYAKLLPQEIRGEIKFGNVDIAAFTDDELAAIAAGQATDELITRLISASRSTSPSRA